MTRRGLFVIRRPRRDIRRRFFLSKKAFRASRPGALPLDLLEERVDGWIKTQPPPKAAAAQ
jgi:hypothetical protein